MKIIDIENWNRKEHYHFFSKMDFPYFGLTSELDCTTTYANTKKLGISFFASYFHKSMLAVNSVPELRSRIVDDNVVVFDSVNAGATISREDGTFAFIYVPFSTDFEIFNSTLQKEIASVQGSTGLRLSDEEFRKDIIRHSTLPWVSFSALLHPTNSNPKESIPKITFGKFSIREGKKYLPVSIEAHHGLVDGLHISKYLTEFQRLLST